MKKILIISFLFSFNLLFSQDSYKVEISSGYIVVDKFPHEFDRRNLYLSNFIQSQITLWKEFDFSRKFDANIGGGYTHFVVLEDGWINEKDIHLHYIHASININHQLFFKNLFVTAGSSIYLKTKKVDQLRFARQYFSSLDLGLSFKFKNKFRITLTSPISIIPMYYGRVANMDNWNERFVFWGETTGFNMGLSYTFFQGKKSPKPTL